MGEYPHSRLYRLARTMPDVRRRHSLSLFPDRTCARLSRRLALPVLPLRPRARPLRVVYGTLHRRPRRLLLARYSQPDHPPPPSHPQRRHLACGRCGEGDAAAHGSSVRTIHRARRRGLRALSTSARALVFILTMGDGIFITLEGVEGSGKTTQAALVADALRKEGRRVTLTHEPGGTRAGEAIRAIFLDPAVSLDVAAELLLVLADRAQHVRQKLTPALAARATVISDRYSDSTTAYQGYGRGFNLKLLSELNRLARDAMAPDLTIVLDCPVETGLQRTQQRAQGTTRRPDRFEAEDNDFPITVRHGFLSLLS